MSNQNLSNNSASKSILITGCRNTGYAIARKLAELGYNIHFTSRSLDEAKAAEKALKSEYPNVNVYGYSLEQSDVKDIRRLFSEIRQNTETLDGFVANAAHLGVDLDIYNTDEEIFDTVINTNVRGTFFCCQEASRLMAKSGGSIVIIGSVQSKGAVEGRTVYGISKAAVSTMAKYLAYDLAPYHIRVNCLIAGAIHTERWDVLDEETLAKRRSAYPLGREADMEDIANGVQYLLTDLSKSTTGTELVIDSGLLVPILPYRDRKVTHHEDWEKNK